MVLKRRAGRSIDIRSLHLHDSKLHWKSWTLSKLQLHNSPYVAIKRSSCVSWVRIHPWLLHSETLRPYTPRVNIHPWLLHSETLRPFTPWWKFTHDCYIVKLSDRIHCGWKFTHDCYIVKLSDRIHCGWKFTHDFKTSWNFHGVNLKQSWLPAF